MNLREKYPYIVKWGQMMGSYEYYIQNQLTQAEADKAPADAAYKRTDGTWITVEEITNPDTRIRLGIEAQAG